MVACSPVEEDAEAAAGREASNEPGVETGGVGRAGSGVAGELGPVWFGFHMGRFSSFRVVAWEGCLRFCGRLRAKRCASAAISGSFRPSGAPFHTPYYCGQEGRKPR